MTICLRTLLILALITVPVSALAAAKGQPLAIPDLTQGDAIPKGARHDWNLGPTGLRGWMFCDRMVTTDARQIAVTEVGKGSPAEGVFRVGDVILGVGGKRFSRDPRTEFGRAVTLAESAAGGGTLNLTRWRAGQVEEVAVRLPVLGSYSATAPYGSWSRGVGSWPGSWPKPNIRKIPSCDPSTRWLCWPAGIPRGFRWSGTRPNGRQASLRTRCRPGTTATS